MGYGSALEARQRTLDCMATHGGLSVLKAMWNVSTDEAKYFATHVRASLMIGELFYWEPEIVDLMDAAYSSMPSWTLTRESLPMPNGLFYFGRPIQFPEVEGHLSQALRAITWMSVSNLGDVDTVTTSSKRTFDQLTDMRSGVGLPERSKNKSGEYTTTAISCDDISQIIVTFYQEGVPQLPIAPVTYARYDIGDTLNEMAQSYREELQGRGDYARWSESIYRFKMQMFACCLAFIEQRIARSESKKAPRAIRRRIERKSGNRAPRIRVVQLRRPVTRKKKDEESIPVDWQHQWIVRGHWRQQWYASKGLHKPKWIHAFIKGPEDKPLRAQPERIFDVAK